MLMRVFQMKAGRRTVAYVIAPDHVAACHSYMDAARRDPVRYPQSVDVFPVCRCEVAQPLPMSQGLLEVQP
jgi:hypothetical protein